ncbi:polycomb group protein [Holotrichia oblita]|uniref:Polycomb group protein n=1 Tax=Holotrichia oblita TaxID=644536 RepID=A0ACB9THR4_HOLOL|nr:polycomb group protein [Holotrichia oblita]
MLKKPIRKNLVEDNDIFMFNREVMFLNECNSSSDSSVIVIDHDISPNGRSQHYDSLQQAADSQQKQPLKDTTNTNATAKHKLNNNEEDQRNNHQEPESTQKDANDNQQQQQSVQQQQQQQQGSRSLQCLETLAQKAGIHDLSIDDCKSTMYTSEHVHGSAPAYGLDAPAGGGARGPSTADPRRASPGRRPNQQHDDNDDVAVTAGPGYDTSATDQHRLGPFQGAGHTATLAESHVPAALVITKPFQGNQLAPHMLTTAQGKQVLQGSQAATFPGYTTIPTIPTTQNQQTLVFSQLGVISSQPNIIPTHSAPGTAIAQQKPQEMHKVMGGQKVIQKVTSNGGAVTVAPQQQGQCVQVSQAMLGTQPTAQIISPIQPNGQPMQFAPWQFPQVWTTNGLQSSTLLAAPNPIFIRGTQPDGSPGMFIQQSPQATTIQTQQNPTLAAPGTMQQIGAKPRPTNENIQPKQPTSRPLNILPSNAANIRPASSVSTQTIGAQAQVGMNVKPGTKVRTKAPGIRTSPAPKADAANQTQIKPYTNLQPHHIVPNKKNSIKIAQKMNICLVICILNIQLSATSILHLRNYSFNSIFTKYLIQGIQQQQIITGDRPIMPVVSMSTQQTAQPVQQLQQTIPGTLPQGLPLQPNLAVTQQMQMGVQQIHPQLTQMTQSGAIIGQIQAAPAAIPQVTASPTQIQQIQQNGQTITISTPPQQVPLPATVPPVKEETNATEATTVDSVTQSVGTTIEVPKENGIEVAPAQPAEIKNVEVEQKPIVNGIDSSNATGMQPAPIPGTVPTQPTNTNQDNNGLPVAATAEEVKERCPPKAMVKPQVLTHVIEDFVIQESSEPFPVVRNTLLSDLKPTPSSADKDQGDEPPRKKHASSPGNVVGSSPKGDLAKCEACGMVDLKAKFKKNNRFCSVACSKNQKYKKDGKKGKWGKDDGMDVDIESGASGAENSPNDTPVPDHDDTPKVDPLKWSVQEVSEFIRNLPGCSDYADDFLIQEIDGQALMLLKEDHLMTAMAMKLGPALKIVAKIDDMRIDKEPPKQ